MQNQLKRSRSPFVLLFLSYLLLWSCTREVDPRADIEEQVSALRFDSTMDVEEYTATSALLQHPLPAPADDAPVQPRLQGATSNRVYTLTYQNYATVAIGGVAYNHTIGEWLAGASAGNVAISPSAFAQLNAALSHQVRIVIGDNPYPWWYGFDLRTITFTELDKGNLVLDGGIYAMSTQNYLYLGGANGVGGQIGTTSCGAIGFGALHGVMGPNYATTNGYVSYNFIAGCSPIIVTASVQFFFTGVANP
jgi:hypothetical protein